MSATVATKSVWQNYHTTPEILEMIETFRQMVNYCLKIGITNNVSSMKSLSKLCYPVLARYRIVSYYKLNAISKAAGMLATRKKSMRRGHPTKDPYAKKLYLTSSYGFKIVDGLLRIAVTASGSGHPADYFDIPLNSYVRGFLSDPNLKVRSFTLTADKLCICYSKKVAMMNCIKIVGIDRNLGNLTAGNDEQVTRYDLSKAVQIAENTRSIVRSFKHNDVRIRKRMASKYGRRRVDRIRQLKHRVSKTVVEKAKEQKTAITFEDIRFIRRLYQSGNGQSMNHRYLLNGWSFAEIKRQIEYKEAWEGVPIITLTKKETAGTSSFCPRCGERLQAGTFKRMLYCPACKREMDRDVVAAMNIAYKGRSRFERSQGAAGEAMRGNPTTAVILRVDAAKLSRQRLDRTSIIVSMG